MLLAIRLPWSSSLPRPFIDTGGHELRHWRKTCIEATYDQTGGFLFNVAVELTASQAAAAELIVRIFTELGQETGVLAEGIPFRRTWLLRRIDHHCRAEGEFHAPPDRRLGFATKRSEAKSRSLGRALYTVLSPIGKSGAF